LLAASFPEEVTSPLPPTARLAVSGMASSAWWSFVLLQPRSEQGRGLQAASRRAISWDVSVPLYPRACATYKRRKRRAPFARAETTLNTCRTQRGRGHFH